ncbi:MAG: hypothetical protein HGB17_13810, partial [Syntrophobacteraceae bacterium]|nr:hypothetical protein [Syntrophobacteraceae bacterium]
MSHTYNQGAAKFAELVKERSNGRIQVTVYPDGQLGKGEREILEAVQQGTIDGQENPINVIYSFKLNETQKFLSMTKHSYAPALFLMSKKVFGGFDAATQ